MHRRKRIWRQPRRYKPPAVTRYAKVSAEHPLRRGRPERHHNPRRDRSDFAFEPRPAGGNFDRSWLAVDPPFAPRNPFEMLYDVGDPDARAIDPRLDQTAIEQFAGWSDKRMPGQIFGVARLLADQHDLRIGRPFPKHGLRRIEVEWAGGALPPLLPANPRSLVEPKSVLKDSRDRFEYARRFSEIYLVVG